MENQNLGMPRIQAMAATAVVLALGVVHSQPAHAVMVMGAPSCGKWMERHNTKSWSEVADMSWLNGYLSGLAVSSNKDILKDAPDTSSLTAWVDNYCRQNPLANSSEAANALAVELARRKGQ